MSKGAMVGYREKDLIGIIKNKKGTQDNLSSGENSVFDRRAIRTFLPRYRHSTRFQMTLYHPRYAANFGIPRSTNRRNRWLRAPATNLCSSKQNSIAGDPNFCGRAGTSRPKSQSFVRQHAWVSPGAFQTTQHACAPKAS
jgi:hypothetical protein